MTVLRLPWSGVPSPDSPDFQQALQENFDRIALEWNNALERTVRGLVNADGTINEGTGFTVAKNGTGDYTVTFTNPFADIPAFVVCSGRYSTALIAAVAANLSAPTASAVRLNTFNSALNQADSDFHFIAVGPS